jgi:ribose 5-phosphate isomerase A
MSEVTAALRRSASEKALLHVESGMTMGLGSGNTIGDFFLPSLADRIKLGYLKGVCLVPTSHQIEFKALEMGLKLCSFNQVDYVDITVDSADLVEKASLTAIKGGGGAMLLEKVLFSISKKVVLVIDEKKLVDKIPTGSIIPVEVLPNLALLLKKRIERVLKTTVKIRTGSGKVGPIITDSGNAIIDVPLPEDYSLDDLDHLFNTTPGIVENGIFKGLVNTVYVGTSAGVLELGESER